MTLSFEDEVEVRLQALECLVMALMADQLGSEAALAALIASFEKDAQTPRDAPTPREIEMNAFFEVEMRRLFDRVKTKIQSARGRSG